MSFVKGLQCRECGANIPLNLQAGCEDCFAPLEVDYHYDAIAKVLTRETLRDRPNSIWRYRELLPIESDPVVGLATGGTPLVRADRLGRKLGLDNLYLKNDSVSFPTLSFKDRVTSMAVNKALEFKLEAVGCASTGNLANSVAANAAAAGLPSFILIPDNLEQNKITATSIYGAHLIAVRGNYDDVNRLCSSDCGSPSLGLRECESAAVLRGRLQNVRLRDRRTARMESARLHRRADGRRRADFKNPQGPQGT